MVNEDPAWLEITDSAVMIDIWVDAGASRTRIMGISEGRLKIQLADSADHARINRATIQFLAKRLGISSAQIEIMGGRAKSKKRVCLCGVSRNQVVLKLSPKP